MAKAYDKVLYHSELAAKMPDGYPDKDSAKVADGIVANWVREKAVLHHAERNLRDEQKDFSKELEDYHNSLIIYSYERELINQKLDTTISDKEIKEYYRKNIENFKLNYYIVKLQFVKLSTEAPNQQKVENWFKSSRESDFDKLYDYCQKYAENYFFEEGKWLYLRDLLKEVPIEQENWDNFLKQNTYYTFEMGRFKYFVHFFDYKLKDDTSPLVLERKKIIDLIRNKRKVALINKMRKDVVNESYETNNIKITRNE